METIELTIIMLVYNVLHYLYRMLRNHACLSRKCSTFLSKLAKNDK